MTPTSKQKFFIYCRKSSESEDRQAASIKDQMDVLQKMVDLQGLDVVEVFTEERSSKEPGRPIFNEMLSRINAGEANGLCTYDNDRLARNPIDNGNIAWLLQKGILKEIKTPGRSYFPEDAGLLLSIEQGRATDYVIRLSKNVRRGLNSRVQSGWRPAKAPIGYINVDTGNGFKTTEKDPDRFDILRRMWDHYLTGHYSVRELHEIVNEQWGLRTPQKRQRGGKKLSMSNVYRILNEPFYTGKFLWTNPDTGDKELFQGKHPAMVTEHEFRRAQILLGGKGKSQMQSKDFSYTGLVRCGECDSSITAEEKNQIICSSCKHKFSTNNKSDCPKCGIAISMMRNPTILQYVYYRCSKKRGTCSQKYIRLEQFEEQCTSLLGRITIDNQYLEVALDYLKDTQNIEYEDNRKIIDSLQTASKQCEARIQRLNMEYTSAQNINYEIYTPEEFRQYKKQLQDENKEISNQVDDAKKRLNDSYSMAERTFSFCALAKKKFEEGDEKMKRLILSSVGSNLTLKDKILSIQLLHPFQLIMTELNSQKELISQLEPKKTLETKREVGTSVPTSPLMRRVRDSNPWSP